MCDIDRGRVEVARRECPDLELGTVGGLEAGTTREELRLVSCASGVRHKGVVQVSPRMESQISYYRQLADHLLLGEPNPVTPEQARRVIGVIQAAELSAERGVSTPPLEPASPDGAGDAVRRWPAAG